MADLHTLLKGYRRFYRKYFTANKALYRKLARSGQSPKTLVIACSDSRVDPSIITDAEPGDIFVVRNVANLVPPYEAGEGGRHGVSAALEFAVCVLKVQHIVIIGHSHCAGIQALVSGERIQKTDFIGKWMDIARPAKEKALQSSPGDLQHACEKEAIQLSLGNLLTFPWIAEEVKKGRVTLHGWYFSIDDGSMHRFDPALARFERI